MFLYLDSYPPISCPGQLVLVIHFSRYLIREAFPALPWLPNQKLPPYTPSPQMVAFYPIIPFLLFNLTLSTIWKLLLLWLVYVFMTHVLSLEHKLHESRPGQPCVSWNLQCPAHRAVLETHVEWMHKWINKSDKLTSAKSYGVSDWHCPGNPIPSSLLPFRPHCLPDVCGKR